METVADTDQPARTNPHGPSEFAALSVPLDCDRRSQVSTDGAIRTKMVTVEREARWLALDSVDATLAGGDEQACSSHHDPLSPCRPLRKLGRFELLGVLGRGGMGIVYVARDPIMDRKVAIKLLLQTGRESHRDRVRREARALARLGHPNIVEIYDFGEQDGDLYMAMELVDGATLAVWQKQERSPSELVLMYLQAGRGLSCAHAAGLIHRDFKPCNVLVSSEGRARVADFGLVHEAEHGSSSFASIQEEPSPSGATSSTSLTRTGRLVGTPAYMAPEQLDCGKITPATDQFSFCVSLFEALYGVSPFAGDTLEERAANVLTENLCVPKRPVEVSRTMEAILLRGLRLDPSERWPSMEVLCERLEDALTKPWRRVVPRVLMLVLPSALVVSAVSPLGDSDSCADEFDSEGAQWLRAVRGRLDESRPKGGSATQHRGRERLDLQVTSWAEQWLEERRSACEGLRRGELSPQVHDATIACLNREMESFTTTLTFLEDATHPSSSVGAADEVERLLRPAHCKRSALSGDFLLPPPPSIAPEVRRIREVLRQCRARVSNRRGRNLDSSCDDVLEPARSTGYPPLEAEALLAVGEAELERGELLRARTMLERSYQLALEHHHDVIALQSAARLIVVNGMELADFEAAERWIGNAHAALEWFIDDPNATALVLGNEANVRAVQGRYEDAISLLHQVLDAQRRAGPEERPNVVATYTSLSAAHMYLEQYERGAQAASAGLELARLVFGSEHPATADLLNNLGAIEYYQGHFLRATSLVQEAFEIRRASLPGDDPRVVSSLMDLGALARSRGDFHLALEHLQQYVLAVSRVHNEWPPWWRPPNT